MHHAPSWYADTAHAAPARPMLVGDTAADVCIVGAGYTGLVTAIELAQRGLSVVVLEAARVGWGASGRNGGQIVTGYNKSIAEIEQLVGKADARLLWDMSEEAKQILAGLVEQHQIDCDLKWGYLLAALKPRHVTALAAHQAELEGLGYGQSRLVGQAEMREMVATKAYLSGLYDAGSGQLHPLNYALGLARAAESLGVRIHEDSRVVRVETGDQPFATTATGKVSARYLVLAGNAYLGGLAGAASSRIMPAGTYIIGTAPMDPARAEALIPSGIAVADINFALNYYRRSPDHRFLFGGGVSYSGFDAPGLKQSLRRTMLQYFPQLADLAIDYLWGGHVAITMNRLPHLGRLSPTTYFAHGYSGHGVALTAMASRVIAEAISTQAERFDVFARIPHRPFPGGQALRMPALVLAMTWYRLRDLI
ncbi:MULTISPECIES: FAD-binding oxidoreductase [unclassified Azospirillum]|uniref:NAD(P)/FAD-dependent oxidoreductase n=1 Tax=unclassified Azospirillum TaxID=2630922 RepID=UPI000B679124|nr:MULTISPECIES: FAD-binding oxidoreductase [unclassified Azospirillum]SNR95246.1 gamma-glutamylputrescine oxidase [Azospirillum sp. RU38E]SNS11608.1 gamma-glutamylputrescine oxidase [Azospirillum sp. RU37A]